MQIDRSKWTHAFTGAFLGAVDRQHTSYEAAANAMAVELDVDLVNSEPPEVGLARFVKGMENYNMFGCFFSFSVDDYKAAAKLADEILTSHGVSDG